MTPLVIDASAGVELVADTVRGRELRKPKPADAVPWVPEIFYLEYGAVLRRRDLNRILTAPQVAKAIEELLAWPLRVTQVRGLLLEAWKHRSNVTFADAIYVALAEHLGATPLADDHRLANTPTCRFKLYTCNPQNDG